MGKNKEKMMQHIMIIVSLITHMRKTFEEGEKLVDEFGEQYICLVYFHLKSLLGNVESIAYITSLKPFMRDFERKLIRKKSVIWYVIENSFKTQWEKYKEKMIWHMMVIVSLITYMRKPWKDKTQLVSLEDNWYALYTSVKNPGGEK